MDTTDCLGLPFPECSPPLTKDASDIEQFRDLALAVDAEVQELADSIDANLVSPPAVSMNGGASVAGQDVAHFYGGSVNFDTAGMADTVADVIRIQSDGWYMIGGWIVAQLNPASQLTLRVEPLLNGEPFSTRQGVGFNPGGGGDRVAWVDVQFLRTGDALTVMTHHTDNPASSVTYGLVGWALRILANV